MIHAKIFFNDKEFSKLVTAGRHKNISVIYVKHNLFQQSKWSRTIDLNTTHIILFKSPRDVQQIGLIGRQLNNTKFLKESYELATTDFWSFINWFRPKDVGRFAILLKHCASRTINFLLTVCESCNNKSNKWNRENYVCCGKCFSLATST